MFHYYDYFIPMCSIAQINQSIKSIVILGISIIVLVFLYAFDPSGSSFYPPCPVHALTGLYCPGCGSLRALHQLLHGHLSKAFGLNPLMVLSLPFLGYSFLSYILDGITGKSLPRVFIPAFYIWVFLWVILLFGILRNISIYPFSLLAP
jgi:hypothetical protein